MDTTSRIFVQIAVYRDPECQWTVRDLFEKATNPDRISVGLCWQFVPDEDGHCFLIETRPDQVRVKTVHALETQGVCWARRETQLLWQGEEYTLVIDSHMRFVQGWDVMLIEELARCDSPKPLLSCDPPAYNPPNNLEPNPKITVKRANYFMPSGEMRFSGEQLDVLPEKPIKGAFIVANFMFSDAKVIAEVPYDPYLYFNQEEVSYSVRLYTHGWDVFSPSRIALYHYYNVGKKSTRPLHWGDTQEWTKFQERGLKRYLHLMESEPSDDPEVLVEVEKYGLGTARTLEDYHAFCGINFKTYELSGKALHCGFIEDLGKYRKRPFDIAPAPAGSKGLPPITKVFGIGLPRSGTTSIAVAMLEMGYKTSHTVFRDDMYNAGDAFFNTPIYVDYPELDRRYPGSKFILTWRDPSKWVASFMRELAWYLRQLRAGDKTTNAVDWRCYTQVFGIVDIMAEEYLIACYQRHRRQAEAYFRNRPGDFLILELDNKEEDHLEVLSRFLGRPRHGSTFPYLNSGEIHDWNKIKNANKL